MSISKVLLRKCFLARAKILLTVVLVAGFCSHLLVSPVISHDEQASTSREERIEDAKDGVKRILYWTSFFDSTDFEFGVGQEPFLRAGCKVTNCWATADRSWLNRSQAVIFHAFNYDERDLPKHRDPEQRFIFFNLETLANDRDLLVFDQEMTPSHYFNWTMTYRRDSDVNNALPYGAIKRKSAHPANQLPEKFDLNARVPDPASFFREDPLNPAKNKSALIIWFYSHCHTHSLREEYFRQLGQYIPVDVYGKCGNKTCLPRDSPECRDLLDQYKFYLAAENSLCPDYVTEKFYRALATNVVPIVYGGADYSAYAPPHSFIHVGDFASPEDLAHYLRLLDQNDALYARYFEWKKEWQVIPHPSNGWCDLCEKLNDPLQPVKTYPNIAQWWYDDIPCYPGSKVVENLGKRQNSTV